MALSIERGARDDATFERRRKCAGPALVFTLEQSVVEVSFDGRRAPPSRVDRASLAVVPARATYRVRSISPVAHVLTLFLCDGARALATTEYAPYIEARTFDRVLGEPRRLVRTRWVDELVHRYVFERDTCKKHRSKAARFLETELAKEMYFLGKEALEAHGRASVVHEGSDLAHRARALLEENLFGKISMSEIAKQCHASESTVARALLREVGVPPAQYMRERRLDEARWMLESGRFSVSEVAGRVGYNALPAFTSAFRKRFGVPPSSVRDGTAESHRLTLPPHGETPDTSPRLARRRV